MWELLIWYECAYDCGQYYCRSLRSTAPSGSDNLRSHPPESRQSSKLRCILGGGEGSLDNRSGLWSVFRRCLFHLSSPVHDCVCVCVCVVWSWCLIDRWCTTLGEYCNNSATPGCAVASLVRLAGCGDRAMLRRRHSIESAVLCSLVL